MYRTESNLQTWVEPLAGLLRIGIGELVERVAGSLYDPDRTARTGIDAFDRLSQGQQAYLLNSVARALLIEEAPAPPLNQAVEATTMAISLGITAAIARELKYVKRRSYDAAHCPTIGQLRRTHLWVNNQFWHDSFDQFMPLVDESTLDDWQEIIDGLFDGVFFDLDMLDEHFYARLPLLKRRELLASMMIDEDYFAWCPREPTESDLAELVSELQGLRVKQLQLFGDEDVSPSWVKEQFNIILTHAKTGEEVKATIWSAGPDQGMQFLCRDENGRLFWRDTFQKYRDPLTEEIWTCIEPTMNNCDG